MASQALAPAYLIWAILKSKSSLEEGSKAQAPLPPTSQVLLAFPIPKEVVPGGAFPSLPATGGSTGATTGVPSYGDSQKKVVPGGLDATGTASADLSGVTSLSGLPNIQHEVVPAGASSSLTATDSGSTSATTGLLSYGDSQKQVAPGGPGVATTGTASADLSGATNLPGIQHEVVAGGALPSLSFTDSSSLSTATGMSTGIKKGSNKKQNVGGKATATETKTSASNTSSAGVATATY